MAVSGIVTRIVVFAYTPKSRTVFWLKKLESNAIRDQEVKADLEQLGWRVITAWECELREPNQISDRLKAALGQRQQ
jgi:DNA mismatch endonuclease (patch repair protein)